jgi:hypothetical protein
MKLSLSIAILEATLPLYVLPQTEILYAALSEATQNFSVISLNNTSLQQHSIPILENARV